MTRFLRDFADSKTKLNLEINKSKKELQSSRYFNPTEPVEHKAAVPSTKSANEIESKIPRINDVESF